MKLKIIITGSKVHGIGYRVMLVNKALSLGISNFNVFNTFLQENQAVFAVIEGDKDVLGEFQAYANTVKPDEAEVDNISFEEYGNVVPPIERVMQAFQMEQWGKGIPILLKMLEKQDTTISVLKSVKEDTAHIPAMREDIAKVKSHTSLIPAMKEDASEIKSNTKEIVDKLQNKYEELSREIVQMKITLAKIETKVFA
ncbi:MAG: acylphosphatase [Candidatus Methanoperedens sp.]